VKEKGSILLIFTEKEMSRGMIMLKGSRMAHLLLPEMLFFGFSFRIQYFGRKSSILEKMGQLEGAISHEKAFEKAFLTFHSR